MSDAEIEKALHDIYASSEEDSDDEELAIPENYAMPCINDLLNNLQGLTYQEKEIACYQTVSSTTMPMQPSLPDQGPSCSLMETDNLTSHTALEVIKY